MRPNAIVRGANRMPQAAITLPRLIVPRCVSWSSVDRRYQLTGHTPGSTRPGRSCGSRQLHPGGTEHVKCPPAVQFVDHQQRAPLPAVGPPAGCLQAATLALRVLCLRYADHSYRR